MTRGCSVVGCLSTYNLTWSHRFVDSERRIFPEQGSTCCLLVLFKEIRTISPIRGTHRVLALVTGVGTIRAQEVMRTESGKCTGLLTPKSSAPGLLSQVDPRVLADFFHCSMNGILCSRPRCLSGHLPVSENQRDVSHNL